MSENRNSDGTFAPSELPVGGPGVEFDQGYRPMGDVIPEEREEPVSDIKAEAERLAASRVPQDPVIEIQYQNPETGEKLDPNLTVSLDRAAKDNADYHAAQAQTAERFVSSEFSAEIDRMRGETLKANPEIGKELGLSKEEIAAAKAAEAAKAEPTPSETNEAARDYMAQQTSEPDPYDAIEGLEPETREALKKPQVRQFLEQNATETEQTKQAYSVGLNNAQAFAQSSLMAIAPELAQVPIERWGEAFNIISQQDPVRGRQLGQVLQTVQALGERQELVQSYQQEEHRRQLDAWRTEQNQIIDKARPMSRADKAQFAEDLVNYVSEFGVTKDNLVQAMENNPLIHSAAFQALAHDAIQYRRMQNAPKAVAKRDLPPVNRPGTAPNSPRGDSNRIASLERQLQTATGFKAARLGAQLLAAKRSANS
jgi:hypothetical protein